MKRFSLSSVAAVVAASLVAAAAASGQSNIPRPFAIGVYGGGSMPIGDFKNRADIGYHAGVFGSTALSGPLSVRLDGAYSKFNKEIAFGDTVITALTKVFHTTLDVEYSLGTQTEMAAGGGALPYISGGAGFYRFRYDDSCAGPGSACSAFVVSSGSETRWGLNAGAGASFFLSGFTPFVDIRYHTTSPKAGGFRFNMVLASFGLKF
ncbi:MAG TPA: outer membrane beta-barrel protein [Gemmatimonadaceae bacterium]|nr:outer membrane beta-barrel protein [Gemmatimonadaceae bacterium]